ncbi:hypothetical protein CDAR_169931 [Caerostris darwini]|uniref:Uncharacterized protein n=1 Tax=Caerostris darwini TaxID=1538125 RepID=A0AAV4RS99_9ARAC|nr:hypothetical protein CDAR_169931 [Caerostris darwini]
MPCSLIGADNEVPHQTQTRCLNNRPTTRSGQRPSSFLSRGAGWDRCREKPRGWSDGEGWGGGAMRDLAERCPRPLLVFRSVSSGSLFFSRGNFANYLKEGLSAPSGS